MAPEAYTVHDAITGYVNNESNEKIRSRAALAYSSHQKCSEKAARNLLVTGWQKTSKIELLLSNKFDEIQCN